MENKRDVIERNRHLQADMTDEQILALSDQLEQEWELTEDGFKVNEAPEGDCPSPAAFKK